MSKKDPYMLSGEDVTKLQREMSASSQGIICPKRNISISGKCAVCDAVQKLFSTGDEADKNIAFRYMAKVNFYMNVVFPEDPTKVVILEIGKKAGNEILDGIENKQWTDIAHPSANSGREMMISKKLDGKFNNYSVSPNMQKADWDIPKEVLDNLPDLDDLEAVLADERLFKISSIKEGSTLHFRICPPWTKSIRLPIKPIFRHFGVSQDDVSEDADSLKLLASFRSLTTENADEKKEEDNTPDFLKKNEPEKERKVDKTKVKKPSCFGNKKLLDTSDPDCNSECDYFEDCVDVVNS